MASVQKRELDRLEFGVWFGIRERLLMISNYDLVENSVDLNKFSLKEEGLICDEGVLVGHCSWVTRFLIFSKNFCQ